MTASAQTLHDMTESSDRSAVRNPQRRRRGPARLPPQPTELQLHIAIVGHLRHRGVSGLWFTHVPNGEFRAKATAAKLKAMGVRAGTPDLVLLLRGRLYALELKRHDGRLSNEQRIAKDDIETAGGFWACAWGVDEALDILRSWGLITPTPGLAAHGALNPARIEHERQQP